MPCFAYSNTEPAPPPRHRPLPPSPLPALPWFPTADLPRLRCAMSHNVPECLTLPDPKLAAPEAACCRMLHIVTGIFAGSRLPGPSARVRRHGHSATSGAHDPTDPTSDRSSGGTIVTHPLLRYTLTGTRWNVPEPTRGGTRHGDPGTDLRPADRRPSR